MPSLTRFLARCWRLLVCRLHGHQLRQTDIYHIEYAAQGYAATGWYVIACARCGRCLGRTHPEQIPLDPTHPGVA